MKLLKNTIKFALAKVPSICCRKSYAKDFLDQRLEPFIGKRNGFFIEAGANDGVSQSNTLYYEKYFNWKGILVEPSARLAKLCRVQRPNCKLEEVALAATIGAPPLKLVEAGLMTTTCGAFARNNKGYDETTHLKRAAVFQGKSPDEFRKIEVPTKTLSQILDECGCPEVDLLSLDVEGYEYEALKGLDLKRHRPRYILVEERYGENYDGILSPSYRKEAILSFNEYYQDVLYRRTQ
jgi:FkbM family methyltransferase